MFGHIYHNRQGYSLIELLVAITVLGLVAIPFYTLFSSSYLAVNNAGSKTAAVNLCRSGMENFKSLGYPQVGELVSEEIPYKLVEENLSEHPGFKRVTTVEPISFSVSEHFPNLLNLYLIEVTVYWEQQDSVRSTCLYSYLGPGG